MATRSYNQKRAETMRRLYTERGGMVNTGRTRFKEGIASWNKGKKLSEKHKAALRGPRVKMQGANHHQWKGGVCSKDYLERRRFKHTMQALVFARDNYTCQICDQYGNSIQVDHIKPWSKYPDLRFELDNCRTLCMACHYYVTFKRKLPQGVVWGHNFNRRVAP